MVMAGAAGAAVVIQARSPVPVRTVRLNRHGDRLAVGYDDGTIRVWPLPAGPGGGEPLTIKGHSNAITALSFSADDSLLCSGGGDREPCSSRTACFRG